MANIHEGLDSTYNIDCTGSFDLHGIKRERSIEVRATSLSDGYHVTGEFTVKLEDHNIKVPKLMFLKVDQNIRLSVDFYLKIIKGEN
jgi:polyisoprenoid-binding protein YceI